MPKHPASKRPTSSQSKIALMAGIVTMPAITKRLQGKFFTFGSGRERHVLVAELAKRGWRYLGQKTIPDKFLVNRYKMTNVFELRLPFKDGHKESMWVGIPGNAEGRKVLKELQGGLPPVEARIETLDPGFIKTYVV